MTTNSPNLPSRVEETLAKCPQFRILLTGIGKSSLISSVFNTKKCVSRKLSIAHDRVGEANIYHGHTFPSNPRFILHDSKGFEPGSEGTWDIVEKFIRDKSSTERSLKDRLHTIW
ncbi:hypothetical protein K435DRAFT_768657 [Dendrothele bispora CBS 962.96]|uniref:G domain-containing protein n=1 Tax=Dendrothele bispora (strain CBS 962.96) TaxID=1314807 RepID=A0A4V4HBI2_DENBC|nr:hypothetical protein K435DRAFT_768657 [Dendrothele bispora CBS 962.96]